MLRRPPKVLPSSSVPWRPGLTKLGDDWARYAPWTLRARTSCSVDPVLLPRGTTNGTSSTSLGFQMLKRFEI